MYLYSCLLTTLFTMPQALNPTVENGRNIAHKNEISVLKAIHHFGHLRRTEIATLVWVKSPLKSAYIMAGRSIKRMLDSKFIIARANSLGGTSYILAPKGVKLLKDENITASEGYDLAFDGPTFYHRTLGTCYLSQKVKEGSSVYGEYAILKDWAPLKIDFSKQEFKKVPDGLIVYPGSNVGWSDQYKAVDWLEVESAFKAYEEVEKAFSIFLKDPALDKTGTYLLNRLIFLADSNKRHHLRIVKYLTKFLKERPSLDPNSFLDNVLVAMANIDIPLSWKGYKEYTIRELIQKTDPETLNDEIIEEE